MDSTWPAVSPPPPHTSHIYTEDRVPIDDVSKLDVSNVQQLQLLFSYMSHNMAVVDFWLNFIVYPRETQQYPQRLTCNAWHLADNALGKVVGFSGTNDNHRLLPLQVHQALLGPGEEKQHQRQLGAEGQRQAQMKQSLMATNGKMLAIILDNQRYDTLQEVTSQMMHLYIFSSGQQRHSIEVLCHVHSLLHSHSSHRSRCGCSPHCSSSTDDAVCYVF